MRIGSLFSGIGGLELGLEWAGVGHTVWQVERDPFCRQVLAKHWPDAQRFEDVRDVGKHNLAEVDVICGGYPCQPFSLVGHRKGETDERHLWPEFARILGEVRPRYAVLENVSAHLSLGFGEVLGDLAALGYDAEWSCVPACSVGAPHSRDRVFVLAYSTQERARPRPESLRPGGGVPLQSGRMGREEWLRRMDQSPVVGSRDGVPSLVDRNQSLGNAVVPQVAEVVGRRLMQLALDNRDGV